MGGIYCYDGTLAGLLTVLARLVPRQIVPEAIGVEPPPQQGLFAGVTRIETDEELAATFWAELAGRLPPSGVRQVRLAFLADRPGRELMICRYCLLAWQEGKRAGGLLAHPQVAPLWRLAQQVGREAHRYLGFVRFREVGGGFYYATIAPDHRVLPLIAGHFADRFRDQRWVIHDERHGEGLVFEPQQRQWLLLPLAADAEPQLTAAEERFQALWRRYFAALAIAERENRRLQQGKVPLKVRPWLVEFATPRPAPASGNNPPCGR
jgi:probable DNA metabolism protein